MSWPRGLGLEPCGVALCPRLAMQLLCYELDDVVRLEGSKPVVIGSLLPMNFRVRLAGPTYQ